MRPTHDSVCAHPTMRTATNPVNPNYCFYETAEIRDVSQRPWPRSHFKLAYVLVSSRMYWKVANIDGTNRPQSIADFRNFNSIELSRLDSGTWSDVHDNVKVDCHNGRMRIVVRDRSHGRTRRNNALLVPNVQVEIVASTPEQHEVWLNQIRARMRRGTLCNKR